MLKNKITSREGFPSDAFGLGLGGRRLELHLLEFLDHFDMYSFLYDAAYRQRLNDLLEGFTDEEFENFERAHSHRFTVN